MAKRKGFNFDSFIDQAALEALHEEASNIAPSKEEVEIVKEASGDVRNLPVSELTEYKNHTYKVLDNEDMEALCESIKDMGIILPLLVREKGPKKFEVVSGHRRLFAAKRLKLKEVPCKIIEVDDSTADIMMVDTNLHREEILPSERAKSYELRIKAMRKKGLLDDSLDSDSQYEKLLAKDVKSSKVNVYRYRKLIKLTDELLDKVDKKEISVNAGAKLAAVPKEDQGFIAAAMRESMSPMTMEAADKIATASRTGLSKEKVLSILDGDFKPRKRKAASTAKSGIKESNIKGSYPEAIKGLSGEDKEAFIKECIKEYIQGHDTWQGYELK